jgi:hypothetical protein
MDLEVYRLLQDSSWVREQRDLMAAGKRRTCPVLACGGQLEAYDVEELRDAAAVGHAAPGGVRCARCGARSRAVSL